MYVIVYNFLMDLQKNKVILDILFTVIVLYIINYYYIQRNKSSRMDVGRKVVVDRGGVSRMRGHNLHSEAWRCASFQYIAAETRTRNVRIA